MYEALIEQGLSELGLRFDERQRSQMERYIAEIEHFNPTYKLVGATGKRWLSATSSTASRRSRPSRP